MNRHHATTRLTTRPAPFLMALIGCLGLILIWPGLASAQEENLNALVTQALKANPELTAIDHQIEALRHKADAVQVWMDPVFAVEYGNFPVDTWNLGDSPMTGVQFKLQQTFSLVGKNSRREAAVRAESDAVAFSLGEKRNQLAAELRRGYWRLALVRQLRDVTDRHVALVGQFIDAVRVKYQVGKVGQHDLMRLGVLHDKLKDDLTDFSRQEREILASLNAILHRDPTEPVGTPELVNPAPFPESELAVWIERAKADHPLFKTFEARVRAKRLAADRAAYERWPDVTLWAGYRIRRQAGMDDGTDQVTLGISIPLPFDYTGHSEAQKATHLSEATSIEAREDAALDHISSMIETVLARWERAYRKSKTYADNLIPDSRRTLDSTLAAYQSDRADFASLYQAELQLLDFERTLMAARSQTHIQQATLDELTGRAAIQEQGE